MKPVIFGLSGLKLTPEERDFFADSQPAGYILFARNIEDREQVRGLTDQLRALHGREDIPILIDQEGGRVSRMKPPVWYEFPAGAVFDRLYDIAPASAIEAARINAEALALDLSEVGITVNCLPLLDVRQAGSTDAIGDRALGSEPLRVAALGRAILDGLERGGVSGLVKHMPGHGRAVVDSHKELPKVDADIVALEIDLAPFIALKDARMAMSAHILYSAWDSENCATMSAKIIKNIIREKIGFTGLLMSDDLYMKALSGDVVSRAVNCIEAGCDIALNCWARMDEMRGIADALPDMDELGLRRYRRACATLGPGAADTHQRQDMLLAKRDALLTAQL